MPWRTSAPRLESAASTNTPYSQDNFRFTPGASTDAASSEKRNTRLSDDAEPRAGSSMLLPRPVTAGSGGGKRRARVEANGLKVHWARFKRRIGEGTAPSTSSCVDQSTGTGHGSALFRPKDDGDGEEDEGVDEVVVDRAWAEDVKSSCPSEHGGSPEKSQQLQGTGGTNTDRDSLALRIAETPFMMPFVFLRWRLWPRMAHFFHTKFLDPKAEDHYRREVWFHSRPLAVWSAVFFIINWVLGIALVAKPFELPDKIFYFGVGPTLSIPLVPMVLWNMPRDCPNLYQTFLTISTWSWSFYQIAFIHWCGLYNKEHMKFSCGNKDFLATFYYTSALQTIALFGLKLNRGPAFGGAAFLTVAMCVLIVPDRLGWIRNVINFVVFQGFLIYIHYMRENSERRMYSLRDQLKIQFRATQKAQVNERKASDSKRRLTSYVFHEVRVPLNTALLAVQNMDAGNAVSKDHDIEFKALEGSLSMMSKVLNDVLDFNRMDSGRFESVHRPYAFHTALRSMLVALKMATDARHLELVTELDPNIDKVARVAAYQAMGYDEYKITNMLASSPADGIVVGDETRLRQIITNLASNACKFTPTGGRLTIKTKLLHPEMPPMDWVPGASVKDYEDTSTSRSSVEAYHPLSKNHLSQHNLHHEKELHTIVVRIEVTDTGIGIKAKDMVQSKLFSPFNQTETGRQQGGKGTGLGLALVRQICKLSGGRLGVTSKAGEGSTFWVELPLGVGHKALEDLDPRPLAHDTISLEAQLLPNNEWANAGSKREQITKPPQASAMTNIMEQGGLVELNVNKRSSGILTRTLGDPSTGTETQPLTDPHDEGQEDPPSPARPEYMHQTSSTTVVERQFQSRPKFVELPGRPNFGMTDSAATAVEPSPVASTMTDGPPSASTPTFEKGLPVLVVDDDSLTRMMMKRMLVRLGCQVWTAENGEIALEMIMGGLRPTPSTEASCKRIGGSSVEGTEESDSPRFAVVFLDNQMPVLSGLQTVARLREADRKEFVVGVTGNALLNDQDEFLEAGVDRVLTKPVLERSLRDMLSLASERRKRALSVSPV